jgi:hypothetical protein
MLRAMMLMGVWWLSACETPSVSTPYADLPPSLLQEPPPLALVPERDLTRAEAMPIWLGDRYQYGMCRSQLSGLISAVTPQ